jgi:hypothetical protein
LVGDNLNSRFASASENDPIHVFSFMLILSVNLD